MGGIEYGTHTSPFQAEPHRLHTVHGRVTVMGQTVERAGEWTVKDGNGRYWSIAETELLECVATG